MTAHGVDIVDENHVVTKPSLSAANFERIATLVHTHAGIKLPPAKRLMAEGRLARRARTLNHRSVNDYCAYLFHQGGLESELTHLIDLMTTNKTDFFREPEHYEALTKAIVPALLERRAEPIPILKIWSVASSTGAEAYTAAMVLSDLVAERRDFRFRIVGTDISTEAIQTAERAIYPASMIDPIPPAARGRHLMRDRTAAGRGGQRFRIVPELRRFVRFYHLNLTDERFELDHDIDVAFLRNVLIYFEKEMQEAVVTRVVRHLRPGGFLALGHSETGVAAAVPSLVCRGGGVFEKREGP